MKRSIPIWKSPKSIDASSPVEGRPCCSPRSKVLRFPVTTNLFGTNKRLELAFGNKPQQFVRDIVRLAESIMPLSLGKIWDSRRLFLDGLKIGLKTEKNGPILENRQKPAKLSSLPMLTSWHSDGGPFVTLPLVYTEHPDGKGHNLGMYRIQRYDDVTTGIHWQIHKGGGYHYFAAEKQNQAPAADSFYRRASGSDACRHCAAAGRPAGTDARLPAHR